MSLYNGSGKAKGKDAKSKDAKSKDAKSVNAKGADANKHHAMQDPVTLSQPSVQVVAARAAVQSDRKTELDVLVRIVPPQVETQAERPLLNIGLVIDRSGSMTGAKLRAARQAASYAVQQLHPVDRVSVTIYDNTVETVVPSTLADNVTPIIRRIERIDAGGSTALHAGWLEGATQVSQHLDTGRLNRVLLLTDGLANAGETNHDRIASDVRNLAQRGVSTTTMGVGNDFDEDLLETMANSGDGHFHFIEGAADFDRIFRQELEGLISTLGTKVSLGIEPCRGVKVLDVFNDLERNSYGRLQLPNLLAGRQVEVVLRLSVPPQTKETDLCFFRLAWDDAQSGQRHVLREALSLPPVSSAEWDDMPFDETVQHQVVRMEAVRMRREAIAEMERGNVAAARERLQGEMDFMMSAAPAAPWLAEEQAENASLHADLESGEVSHATKFAKHASYRKRRGH